MVYNTIFTTNIKQILDTIEEMITVIVKKTNKQKIKMREKQLNICLFWISVKMRPFCNFVK